MARPYLAFAAALVLAPLAAPAAGAQSPLAARLANDRLGEVRTGTYQAGPSVQFALTRAGGHYLLQFAGSPEIFVLYSEQASFGGRVLRYDTGRTVLRVAGWGGITIYTDKRPEGLPAVRTGDATPLNPPPVTPAAITQALSDEAAHLAYVRHLSLTFRTGRDAAGESETGRAVCFDALQNAARGIERFTANPAAYRAFNHIRTVFVRATGRPRLDRRGPDLIVTYDPAQRYAGRASSRAIDRALHSLFHIPQKPE